MAWRRIHHYLRLCAVAWLIALPLAGSEHHGEVNFGGLPVPGATVTATRNEKKLSTVTDLQGRYSFSDLADGAWTIQVEMSGFFTIERAVTIAPNAPEEE